MKPNTTRPGLPNYTGPNRAWVTWGWHNTPVVSMENIDERFVEVDSEKQPHEIPIRRAAMYIVPEEKLPEYLLKALEMRQAAWEKYLVAQENLRGGGKKFRAQQKKLYAVYEKYSDAFDRARPRLLKIAAELVPDAPVRDGELVFDAR